MVKKGIIILISLLVGTVSIICIGTYLLYPQDYNPVEGCHSKDAGVIFSGLNNSGVVACPWIINQTDKSILGANREFRDYFNKEISKEIQQYSWLTGFSTKYVGITHMWDMNLQLSPNLTGMDFDPYYASIRINVSERYRYDVMKKKQWDKEVAPTLETIFSEKWYINRFEFMIVKQQ
ncbi:MAG: hypothetical protein ACXADY_07870 [Candidatus Hodarchaeales archaeon]